MQQLSPPHDSWPSFKATLAIEECRHCIGSPGPEECVGSEPDEQGRREVGAEHVLLALALGRRRAELLPNAGLAIASGACSGACHRELDPYSIGFGLVSGEQRPQRLEAYIGGDHVQGDELLGASFYAFGGAQPWPSCFGGVGYGYSLRERNCSSCSVAW